MSDKFGDECDCYAKYAPLTLPSLDPSSANIKPSDSKMLNTWNTFIATFIIFVFHLRQRTQRCFQLLLMIARRETTEFIVEWRDRQPNGLSISMISRRAFVSIKHSR